jgi:hypothetical protein
MAYKEFSVRESSRIDKYEFKLLIVFAVFSVLLAIPLCLRDALGLTHPQWYWANSGNIFADWSIYYLNFLPIWVIISSLWLLNRLSLLNIVKWTVFFYLGYWLFYDWVWWFLVMQVDPASFSWGAVFYFDIIIPRPQMWFFLLVAIVGFFLSILLLQLEEDSYRNLVPFILYLVYVYLPGVFGEVLFIDDYFYLIWSLVFIPLILVSFACNHIYRKPL